jgi:hypothetical protein
MEIAIKIKPCMETYSTFSQPRKYVGTNFEEFQIAISTPVHWTALYYGRHMPTNACDNLNN